MFSKIAGSVITEKVISLQLKYVAGRIKRYVQFPRSEQNTDLTWIAIFHATRAGYRSSNPRASDISIKCLVFNESNNIILQEQEAQDAPSSWQRHTNPALSLACAAPTNAIVCLEQAHLGVWVRQIGRASVMGEIRMRRAQGRLTSEGQKPGTSSTAVTACPKTVPPYSGFCSCL
jgi:hypothetical protein